MPHLEPQHIFAIGAFAVLFALMILTAMFKHKLPKSESEKEKEKSKNQSAEVCSKRIREKIRLRDTEFEYGEYDMPCPKCGEMSRPVRDSYDHYDCAKCDKEFDGPRHDF